MRPPSSPSTVLVLILLCAGVTGTAAQDGAPLRVPRTSTPPAIDGRLDDSAWVAAPLVALPYEWYPADNAPAPVATACFLTGDDAHLYIACRAQDPTPAAIRHHFADRDRIGGDDQIVVLLDPLDSSRRGFRFAVTALGVQADALYSEETGSDDTWDATWQSAGRVTDSGYAVELALPFSALRLPDVGTARSWRIVIERTYPRSTAYQLGSVARDRNNNCLLCQAPSITGVGPRGGRAETVALQPTLTATRTELDRVGEPFQAASDVQVGITGRWEITPAIRLNAALNPDFSQVEADAAEFELNRRFALAFDEKRPFFLDGQNYFDVPADLVFTRTVVDPIAGLKTTGSAGQHALGAFVTVDAVNSIILPGSERSRRVSREANVAGAVGRYRIDLPNSSSLGVLATDRRATDYQNTAVAIDGAIRVAQSHRVRFVVARSRTDDEPAVDSLTGRLDGGAFTGALWNLRYDLETRSWGVEAGHRGISSGFRDDAGLVQRVDLTGPEVQVTRVFWGDGFAWFDRIALAAEGQSLATFSGVPIDEKIGVSLRYDGPLQTEIAIDHAWRRETFAGQLFSRGVTGVAVAMRPGDAVGLGLESEFGDQIDVDNAQLARLLEIGTSADLRLGRALRIAARSRYQRLTVAAGRLFGAVLTDARVEYHFGLRTFVRLIVQHRDVRRDPERFADPVPPHSNRLFAQALFSYRLNPETVLFLGYSGTAQDFTGLDVAPQERAVFLKIGYGLRP